MTVNTKPFGTIEVDERQKVTFPAGILGFADLSEYVLLDAAQEPFYWLQSLESPDVAFVMISPFIFRPDYDPGVPQEELQEIGIESEDDTIVFTIVTIPEDQNRMTANLQGPVIINKKNRLGRQSVSMDNRWKVRHVILEELAAVGSGSC